MNLFYEWNVVSLIQTWTFCLEIKNLTEKFISAQKVLFLRKYWKPIELFFVKTDKKYYSDK